MGFIREHEPQVYALMRIVTGFLFLWHGSQKVIGWPPMPPMPQEPPAFIIWTAGPLELVGGLLVMIGLFMALIDVTMGDWPPIHGPERSSENKAA